MIRPNPIALPSPSFSPPQPIPGSGAFANPVMQHPQPVAPAQNQGLNQGWSPAAVGLDQFQYNDTSPSQPAFSPRPHPPYSDSSIYGVPGDPQTRFRPPETPPPQNPFAPDIPVRVVYNNDTHKQLWAMPDIITGFHQKMEEGRRYGNDVLALNGGDNFIGRDPTTWPLQIQEQNLQFLNAAVMGNHELDMGTEAFVDGLLKQPFNAPYLVSNVIIPPENALNKLVQTGRLITSPIVVHGDHSDYGLIGVTTPNLFEVRNPEMSLQGLQPLDLKQTAAIVQQQINALKAQGINKVFVLSHMGFDMDQMLAQQVNGIDVIIGGHSHDTLKGIVPGKNWVSSQSGDPVLIVQAGKNGKYFGVLDLLFDPQGRVKPYKNRIYKSSDFPRDPQAEALLHQTLGTPKPVGYLASFYLNENNSFGPDPMAAFLADTIRKMSQADIAIVRANELRKDLRAGVITDQDAEILCPFPDTVVRYWLTGQELKTSLERGAKGVQTRDNHPGLIHPSGVMYTIDGSTGAVQNITVYNQQAKHWEPLDLNKRYTVATGRFAIDGKEWPEMKHPERVDWDSGMPMRDIFLYGLQQKRALTNPLELLDDGRVHIMNQIPTTLFDAMA